MNSTILIIKGKLSIYITGKMLRKLKRKLLLVRFLYNAIYWYKIFYLETIYKKIHNTSRVKLVYYIYDGNKL